MSEKKEKMSIGDFIRYVLLIFAIILLVFLIVITLKVYQNYEKQNGDDTAIEIMTEAQTTGVKVIVDETEPVEIETESETASELATELEAESESESETENVTSVIKPGTPAGSSAANAESEKEVDAETADANNTASTANGAQNAEAEEASSQMATFGNGQPAYVTTDCNVRSSAEMADDNVVGGCTVGDTVEFLGEQDGWAAVNIDGEIVYISANLIELGNPPAEYAADYVPEPVSTTISSACYIRSNPDYGDNILGEVYAGQEVEYYGIVEGWAKINADGVEGYIGPKFLN